MCLLQEGLWHSYKQWNVTWEAVKSD
jgi:hypothetical protein